MSPELERQMIEAEREREREERAEQRHVERMAADIAALLLPYQGDEGVPAKALHVAREIVRLNRSPNIREKK